jgi:copper chaperone CopZ
MNATVNATVNAAVNATVGQRFEVSGMICGHCGMAVSAEIHRLAGVTRVEVDVASGTVVTESVEPLAIGAVAAAVDEAGYRLVSPVPPSSATEAGR